MPSKQKVLEAPNLKSRQWVRWTSSEVTESSAFWGRPGDPQGKSQPDIRHSIHGRPGI